MLSVASFLRRRFAASLVACVAIFGLIALIGPAVFAGLDRNQRCVSNAGQIAIAMAEYAQDYDELLPQPVAFSSLANLQTLLNPYVQGDASVWRCPANGNAFYTPNAALGGQTLTVFRYLDEVEVVRDSKPHPDGKITISFLDGHVERGGVYQGATDVVCRQRVQQITLALLEYAQDYNQILPFQQNDDDFRAALDPYLKSRIVWRCPDTKQFYTLLSPDNRGKGLFTFPDTAPIIVAQDPVPHQNGIVTTGYLDGYVEQRGPNGVTYPPTIPGPDVSLRNIRLLGAALAVYTQDYDECLPIYSNYPDLLQKLYPYLSRGNSSRTFPSFNQPTYVADPAYSGLPLAAIATPAQDIWLRDVYDFGDGLITVGYLDGHAERIPPPPSPKPVKPKPVAAQKEKKP